MIADLIASSNTFVEKIASVFNPSGNWVAKSWMAEPCARAYDTTARTSLRPSDASSHGKFDNVLHDVYQK